jgi:hypothetical protein
MKKNQRVLSVGVFVIYCVVSYSGCSTALVRVMPGENNLNRVVASDRERDDAEKAALKGAQEYCEKKNQEAIIVSTADTKYTGKMDEGVRDAVKKGSTAAMILGGPVSYGPHSSGSGSELGRAGLAGQSMTNDRDYRAELTFRCK